MVEGQSAKRANKTSANHNQLMKQYFLSATAAWLLAIGAVSAQTPATTPEQAITYFFDGFSELSDAKMRAYISADFLLLEDGVVWNADSLSVAIARRKGLDFKRTNSFRYIRTEVQGTSAVVAYYNHADVTINGKQFAVDWLESAQLVKEGEGWKIRLMHSTPIKPKK